MHTTKQLIYRLILILGVKSAVASILYIQQKLVLSFGLFSSAIVTLVWLGIVLYEANHKMVINVHHSFGLFHISIGVLLCLFALFVIFVDQENIPLAFAKLTAGLLIGSYGYLQQKGTLSAI